MDMKIIFEQSQIKWTLDRVKDYISQFKTRDEFTNDPKYDSIKTWVSNYKGPNGEKLYIKDLTSDLEKKGSRRKSDEEVTNNLKKQFPQWNFDNITYRFNEKNNQRYIDGLYCEIEDENGIPHGITNNVNVKNLVNRGSGCRKCGIEKLSQSKLLDISEWIKEFPSNKGFIFDSDNFYYRTEGLRQKTPFVKNVICTKHDPPIVFAKNGVSISSLRRGLTGCPICGRSETKGERKLREELMSLGYEVNQQKTFPDCFGYKGKRYCDLLKFDSHIIKKDGTEVCVEYDGEQHFVPIKGWGGIEGLKSIQERDQLKTEYCEKNNIKLIRIPYWDYNNIGEILKRELGENSSGISEITSKKNFIISELQFKYLVRTQSK